MGNREEIINKIKFHKAEQKKFLEQLKLIDNESVINNLLTFKGKYLKEDERFENIIRFHYIYDVDVKTLELKVLEINHNTITDTYFNISQQNVNETYYDDDGFTTWREIKKEEFECHYNEILLKIKKIIV